MIILLRSDDLTPDPRVEKYVNFYKQEKISYKLVGWNRNKNINPTRTDAIFYGRESAYGSGSKNILNLFFWNFFLLQILFKNRKQYNVIHACDFDTMLPATIIKILFGKKLVFDVFDWYTDSRNVGNKIIKGILTSLERWVAKKADFIIICEEERIVQLPSQINKKKVYVHRNLPDDMILPEVNVNQTERKGIFNLAYVGVFDSGRGLEELLDVVSKCNNIILDMAGFGRLSGLVEEYADKYDNINFLGSVKHDQAMSLMGSSDIIVGMYYTVNRNHILAAPNKYYEALFLGKPLLTNIGTIVGERTQQYQTGYAIEEGKEAITKFINNISGDKNQLYGNNARELFLKKYKNSSADFLNNDYLPFVKS